MDARFFTESRVMCLRLRVCTSDFCDSVPQIFEQSLASVKTVLYVIHYPPFFNVLVILDRHNILNVAPRTV